MISILFEIHLNLNDIYEVYQMIHHYNMVSICWITEIVFYIYSYSYSIHSMIEYNSISNDSLMKNLIDIILYYINSIDIY